MPGIRIAAPRDPERLRETFREAIAVEDGPTLVRFPKGTVADNIDAVERLDSGVDVLHVPAGEVDEDRDDNVDVLLVAVGTFAEYAMQVAHDLAADGIRVTVIDPRWVVPVSPDIVSLAVDHDMVVVYEDGIVRGGVGSAIGEALAAASVTTPVRHLAFPDIFPEHASRGELLAQYGLDPVSAAQQLREWVAGLEDC